MTSEAPERVVICPDDMGHEREWANLDWKPHMGPWVEYLRADLAHTRADVEAAVKRALDAAVDAVGVEGDTPTQDPDYMVDGYGLRREEDMDAIRALCDDPEALRRIVWGEK